MSHSVTGSAELHDDIDRITHEASEWVKRLGNADESSRAEFASWVSQSYCHFAEFVRVQLLFMVLDSKDDATLSRQAECAKAVAKSDLTGPEGAADRYVCNERGTSSNEETLARGDARSQNPIQGERFRVVVDLSGPLYSPAPPGSIAKLLTELVPAKK